MSTPAAAPVVAQPGARHQSPRALPPAPAWLLRPEPSPRRPDRPSRQRRTAFLSKTIGASAALIQQALYAESPPQPGRAGLARRLDPRVKLLGLVLLLVALAVAHSPITLVGSYLVLLALGWAGGIPVGSVVQRGWLAVGLFTALAVAPATLSVVTPGRLVVPLWSWQGTPHGLTEPGLLAAALILTRVACSISLVLMVTMSTPWSALLGALGALGVPRVFLTIVAMAHRYLVVLLGAVLDLFLARRARTVQPSAHDSADRRFVGAAVGTLLGKAGHLAEQVHQAMTARGYTGRHPCLQTLRWTRVDLAVLVGALALAGLIIGVDHQLR